MQTKTILLLCTGLLLTASCKKDEDKQASKTDLLTSGQWRLTAYTLSPAVDVDFDGVPDADVYATMLPCEKDNYVVFRRDGTGETNEGASKCNAADPQTEPMSWSLSADETVLEVDGDRATIQELTSAKLVLTQPILGSTMTVTFGK